MNDGMMQLGPMIADVNARSYKILSLLDPHYGQEDTKGVRKDPTTPLQKVNTSLDDLAIINDRLSRIEKELESLLERF